MLFKGRYTAETYQDGATRIKRKFAWLPVRINGDIIWLEKYEVFQLYKIIVYEALSPESGKQMAYRVNQWIDLSLRIIT